MDQRDPEELNYVLIAAGVLVVGGFVALIIGSLVHAPYLLGMIFAGIIILGFAFFAVGIYRWRKSHPSKTEKSDGS